MIGNFIIQKGSTLPWLDVQVTQDGFVDLNLEAADVKGCAPKSCGDKSNTVDLTDAQIAFELYKCGRVPSRVATMGQAEIVDATCGLVRYKWAIGDLTDACLYYGTFVITMTDGTLLRWPYAMEQLTIEVR